MLKIHLKQNIDNYFKDSKDFIEYSNDNDGIYENIEESNSYKNAKYWSYLKIWFLIYLIIKNVIQ